MFPPRKCLSPNMLLNVLVAVKRGLCVAARSTILASLTSLFPDSNVLSNFVTEPVVMAQRELIVHIQKLATQLLIIFGGSTICGVLRKNSNSTLKSGQTARQMLSLSDAHRV